MEHNLKKKSKKGLSGVVIFAVISFISSLILSYNNVITEIYPFSFDEQWLTISNLALDSYNKQWMKLIIFNLVSDITVLLFGIMLLIMFIKRSKYITLTLVFYFMYRVLLVTLIFYFRTVIKGPLTPDLTEIGTTAINSLIIPALWVPYLLLSEKVRETFIF